ncbi:hypothetical protein KDL30_09855 [bacterium]|nr:hypothetical protein [bacterium]
MSDQTPTDTAKQEPQEQFLYAFNDKGQRVRFSREQWAKHVIPQNVKLHWKNPDALFALLQQAVQGGFFAEIEAAAWHLQEIDRNLERGTSLLAHVLLRLGKLDECEKLIDEFIDVAGPTGNMLTGKAKLMVQRDKDADVSAVLREALKHSPNNENTLHWYALDGKKKDGMDGLKARLREACDFPGSFLPQIRLGGILLEEADNEGAIELYESILDLARRDGNILLGISSAMAQYHLTEEMIDMLAPVYNFQKHGPYVGMNLAQAMTDAGRHSDARQIVKPIRALNNPQFNEYLDTMDKQEERRMKPWWQMFNAAAGIEDEDAGNAGTGEGGEQ